MRAKKLRYIEIESKTFGSTAHLGQMVFYVFFNESRNNNNKYIKLSLFSYYHVIFGYSDENNGRGTKCRTGHIEECFISEKEFLFDVLNYRKTKD